ncbi:MAG: MFS transporter [Treponema sp.]|jgi:GPH family glycoside/pentoside/hexuronide:cation symporter|nr:MFS transporter [Treponema sp.]
MTQKKLSVKQKLGFGIFDLGGNMLFTVMGFWCLNYLTDTAGLAAAFAGTAVMMGKLWDAVTDPVMGYISDRTRSRWGRRRPYLLFGAVPMFLSMWLFFTAPGIENPILLTMWASLTLMLVNTASTVINIPYSSLTPELTGDYHERTSLNGYRFGCAVFGTIIGAAAVQPIVGLFRPEGTSRMELLSAQRTGYSFLGFILGAIMLITTLLTFWGTREQAHPKKDMPKERFFATYKAVFTNRPYLLLLLTYALHLCGITLLQGILIYYTKYIFKPEETISLFGAVLAQEQITTPAMLLLLLTAMLFIPVSVLVSKHIGKKLTYQICFVILASACLLIFTVGHFMGPVFFLAVMIYAGVGVGFSYVAPFAMVPDAIEYDAVKSGERKEGAYYGIWTFIAKVGQSLAVFISGLILDLGGYIADAVQSSGAITAIRIIVGPLPAIILAGALIVIQFYPLDEKTYREIIVQEKGM